MNTLIVNMPPMNALSTTIVVIICIIFALMVYYMADLWAERLTFKGNDRVRKCRHCGRFYRRDKEGIWRMTIGSPSGQECYCQKWENKK
ncbi:MAG: hypothetical protein WC961_07320 [Anaerovoracaceae bacterium]